MLRYINLSNYNIPIYGLCLCASFLISLLLSLLRCKMIGEKSENIIIIIAVTLGTALLGGSIFYILITYNLNDILDFIKNREFSFIFNSGLVFYGGLLGGISGAIISTKLLKIQPYKVEMIILPILPLTHAIGRIGCLLSGCCYGFQYNGIFAIENIYALPPGKYFPIQAVEIVFNLIIMIVLLFYTKKRRNNYYTLCLYLTMYSVVRFFIEFFRGDQIRGQLLFFSTSQWISLLIFITTLITRFYLAKRRNPNSL